MEFHEYYPQDDNGVEVRKRGADAWLVGTWQYDSIGGTIRDLATRMVERLSHGDDDWRPLKVYALGQGGELRLCETQTFVVDGDRYVTVVDAASPPAKEVAVARFRV